MKKTKAMVNNFEKETMELTPNELGLVPIIVKGLSTKIGEENAITSVEIIRKLELKGVTIHGARLRKIINHIRVNNIIFNLLATSKGYYIATNQSDCRRFIESLDQRANAIITVRDAMEYQMKQSNTKDGNNKENAKPHPFD